MLSLATLLTHSGIDFKAKDAVTDDIVEKIHDYIQKLHADGLYDKIAKQVLTHKLGIQIFDVVSNAQNSVKTTELLTTSDSDLDRQVRAVDSKLGGFGFPNHYAQRYGDIDNPDTYKIDCILYALDDNCIAELNNYAAKKFHELNDNNRRYIVAKDEQTRKQYSDIVANGDTVSKHNFTLPEDIQAYKCSPDEGREYFDHLFADRDTGKAYIKLDSSWEYSLIIEEEMRPDFVCWLRNLAGKSWALTIPYEMNHEVKAMYPDFIIIRNDDKLGYVVDILEPHNSSLKDNLPKAIGLAKYAENEQQIGRVQLIREGKDPAGKVRLKRLDFSKGEIRNKVLIMHTSEELDDLFDTDGFFMLNEPGIK
jgi:type III restriction enzyme